MSTDETTRYQTFCQFRKEIRGAKDYLIVGIDIAKEKNYAFMGTANGKSLYRKLIFKNNIEGFKRVLTYTDATRLNHGLDKTVFGMEPTGNYHKPLGEYLIRRGHLVVLVSGVGVKRNREMVDGRWDKHDTKDAAVIADLVSQGKCFYYELPTPEILTLRGLLSLRKRLKKEEHSLIMRIRNHLVAVHFPEIDRLIGPCGGDILNLICRCVDPRKIADMAFDEFCRRVSSPNGRLAQQKRLLKIYQLAPQSVGCPINAAVVYESEMLVQKLIQLRKDLREVGEKIKRACRPFGAYECLLSIPGFGPFVSSQTLAVIGDPFRFKNRQQVLKLAGFDLNANRSGKTSDQAVPVLSKRGNSALRYALYQAALIASFTNELFVRYFAELIRGRERERGIKTKMRVKLAAKMLIIAWTLMKKNELFDPDYFNSV